MVLPALIEGFAAREGLVARRGRGGGGSCATTSSGDERPGPRRDAARRHRPPGGVADLVAGGPTPRSWPARSAPAEEAALRDAGRLVGEPRLRLLGRDALVAATGRGQRVTGSRCPTSRRAFAGEIASWAALGGEDAPIRAPPRAPGLGGGRGLRGAPARARPGSRPPGGDPPPRRGGARRGARGRPARARPPALRAASGEAQPLALAGACGLPFVPRAGAVRAGDYPLTAAARAAPALAPAGPGGARPPRASSPRPDAQLALRRAGLVGTEAVPIPLAEQGERLAAAIAAAGPEVSLADLQRLVATLAPLTRLSTTLRFDEGAALDAASRALLLAARRRGGGGALGRAALLLAGFTDGAGPAADNLALVARAGRGGRGGAARGAGRPLARGGGAARRRASARRCRSAATARARALGRRREPPGRGLGATRAAPRPGS